MRQILTLLAIIILVSCQTEKETSDFLNLKIKKHTGFGPFSKSFSFLDWTSMSEKGGWSKTEIKTIGIPNDWTESNVNQVWLDAHQFAYQNYKAGKIDEKMFTELKEVWKIDLKKRKLSQKAIKCFVHIAIGKNQDGDLEYIVDVDNNNDFSNDLIRKPTLFTETLNYSAEIENAININFEISTNNGIRSESTKVLVLENSNGELLYNFPFHATSVYNGKNIYIGNSLTSGTYDEKTNIINDTTSNSIVSLNEFIKIEDNLYKNLGVDINNLVLKLQRMPNDTILYSTKIGFNAKPFFIKKLGLKDSISLSDFNNKLLYLEFWGTWCAPCIKELPNLKNAYDNTSRNDVEFLGVAVYDTEEKLKNVIEEYKINWPQALDSESNKLKEEYGVTGYPTSFLINKKGNIIAKNLRGEKLLDTLNYYLKQ